MKFSLSAFVLLALLSLSFAEDLVAVNSMDGRDVLSGIFYANVKGIPVRFMPYPGGNADLFAAKTGFGHSILLVQSSTPVSSLVENGLKANNNSIELFQSLDGASTNLELARRSNASRFIIVDSAFADSAISVMAYASLTKSYVILADKGNIDEVADIVEGKEILIYGLVDPEVRDALAAYSPELLGKGEDKYEDNILLVGKAMDEFSIKEVIISDGSFVEESMAVGDRPVLLSGRIVPQVTEDFIRERVKADRFSGVMLVGNDLVVPVYDMRQRVQNSLLSEGLNKTFGITVKFAQVVPSAGSSVLTLDTFRMPAYKPSIDILEVVYNRDSGNLTVSLNNSGEGPAFYIMDVKVLVDGKDFRAFGGEDAVSLGRGEQGGNQYPLDLSSVPAGSVSSTVLVKFGSTKKSLDSFTTHSGNLTTISYTDTSNVSVQFARYDPENKRVLVTLRNLGSSPAYVNSRLGIILGGLPANVSGPGTVTLEPGALSVQEFPLDISPGDLASNRNVSVFLDYGGRPGFLLKHSQYIVPLEGEGGFPLLAALGVVAVIIIAAALLLGRKTDKSEKVKGRSAKDEKG